MPNCISCGRELPPPGDPQSICPECRDAILARAPSQNPLPARRSAMLSMMPVTSALIGVNLVVFVAMVCSGVSPIEPQTADLMRWGANKGCHNLTTQSSWRTLTSNCVNLGGLVSGLALGAVLAPRLTSPPDERNSWRRFVFIVAGAVLALAFELARHLVLRQFIQQPTP